MKRIGTLILAAAWALALLTARPAAAVDHLVSVDWLAKHLKDKGLVVLDVRTFSQYEKDHIPGAVQAFGPWQTMDEKFRGFMMPPVADLVEMLRSYGVNNDSFVVIYDQGITAQDTARSARALWTLEVLGHDKVAILDGGFEAWRQKELPTTKKHKAPARGNFSASIVSERLITLGDVKKRLRSGRTVFVDLRDMAEYIGHEKKAHIPRYGHLKGAIPLPASYLTIGGQNFSPSFLRKKEELEDIAVGIGLPKDRSAEIVVYSNHGLQAALGYFVLHDLLGYRNVRLFDGSILEASRDDSVPMVANSFGYYEH